MSPILVSSDLGQTQRQHQRRLRHLLRKCMSSLIRRSGYRIVDFEFRTVKGMMTMWWMPELVKLWKEVFRSSVWFYVQRFVCDKYPETCSKVAVQPAPKSVAVQQPPKRSHSRRREQASNDEERSSYEQRRLEQRMSRPPGYSVAQLLCS